jgi:hypothetical protein
MALAASKKALIDDANYNQLSRICGQFPFAFESQQLINTFGTSI